MTLKSLGLTGALLMGWYKVVVVLYLISFHSVALFADIQFNHNNSESQIQSSRQIQSPEDYQIHMTAHRLRLIAMALELHKTFSAFFPNLSEALIIDWMSLHDQSKVNTDPDYLAYFDQSDENHIARRLYQSLYGKSVSELPEEEKKEALKLINELNEMDDFILQVFAQRRGLIDKMGKYAPIVEELRHLEKLVDLTDRELDPIATEEFGRRPKPAHGYFFHPLDRIMIFYLRENYLRITQGLQYVNFKQGKARPLRPNVESRGLHEASMRFCSRMLRELMESSKKALPRP